MVCVNVRVTSSVPEEHGEARKLLTFGLRGIMGLPNACHGDIGKHISGWRKYAA